jgi:hypothetical protein
MNGPWPPRCHQASAQFVPEGSGPLGVEPTCILRLSALDIPGRSLMHDRRPRRTFLHKKRVPDGLLGASLFNALFGQAGPAATAALSGYLASFAYLPCSGASPWPYRALWVAARVRADSQVCPYRRRDVTIVNRILVTLPCDHVEYDIRWRRSLQVMHSRAEPGNEKNLCDSCLWWLVSFHKINSPAAYDYQRPQGMGYSPRVRSCTLGSGMDLFDNGQARRDQDRKQHQDRKRCSVYRVPATG